MKSWLSLAVGVMLLTVAQAAITIDPASRTFAKTGGAGSILTAGSGTWTATTDVDWISIKPRTSGDAGVSCVYVVSQNKSADVRVGHVIVAGNVHTVTQNGYEATLDPQSVTIDLNGGEGNVQVAVEAGVSWSVVCDVDWLSFSVLSGVGPGCVAYSVTPYNDIVSRTTSVKIAGQLFSIVQTGKDVQVNPVTAYVGCDAGLVEIAVRALETTKWNVTPDVEWVSVADGEIGHGDATLLIAYAANESFNERESTLKIGSANFVLKQKGVEKVDINFSPDSVTANPNGAYGIVDITATKDGPWSATSYASWLTLVNDGGVGSGLLEYVVSPNLTLEPRVGQIKVMPYYRIPNPDLYAGLVYWHDNKSYCFPQIYDCEGWSHFGARAKEEMFSYEAGNSIVFKGTNTAMPKLFNPFAFVDSDGFTIGLHICFDDLDAINRIAKIGRLNLFIDADRHICVNNHKSLYEIPLVNGYFSIMLSQSVNGSVSVYVGELGSELIGMLECVEEFAFSNFACVMPGEIVFGHTDMPSAGYLSGARINDIRVWDRCLTVEELVAGDVGMCDFHDKFSYDFDEKATWYYLPLDGNLLVEKDGQMLSNMGCVTGAFSYNNESCWRCTRISSCENRFGLKNRALKCSAKTTSMSILYPYFLCWAKGGRMTSNIILM